MRIKTDICERLRTYYSLYIAYPPILKNTPANEVLFMFLSCLVVCESLSTPRILTQYAVFPQDFPGFPQDFPKL